MILMRAGCAMAFASAASSTSASSPSIGRESASPLDGGQHTTGAADLGGRPGLRFIVFYDNHFQIRWPRWIAQRSPSRKSLACGSPR